MGNVIKLKRSSTGGAVPTVGSLELGELAVNTTDGRVFLKKSVSGVESIVDLSAAEGSTYYTELHVNFDYTGTVSNGAPEYPYKTIQAAVDAVQARPVGTSANACIFVHGKKNAVINENVTINAAVNYLYLKAEVAGNIDTSAVSINGSLTISGTSNRVRVEGLSFNTSVGTPALTINGSPGRHAFYNCQFQGGGVSFTGSYQNWYEFVDCTVTGAFSIAGTPAANTLISFYRLRAAQCTFTQNAANSIVAMYDTYGMYSIAHQAGTLALTGLWGWGAGTFTSTANAGLLSLADVSLLKTDYTYAALNKSGTAYYLLNNVQRNETQDTLNGTRVAFGASATDAKYVAGDATDWSVLPTSVKVALDNLADTRANKSDVTALQSSVSTLQSNMTTAQSNISALQSDVNALETSVGAAQGDISALESSVSSLQSDVTTLQGDVDALAAEDLTLLKKDGSRALTGDLSAGGNKITNLFAPSANGDAANKEYVDDAIVAGTAELDGGLF